MKKELLTYKEPKSPVSEVFRTLRTNIQFMNTNRKMKTLLVTSTFPEEGKSWVTSNLAVTFAQAGKKVILIDADMRKGRQYKIFDVLPKPGLSNYLSNMDSENLETEDVNVANLIQETGVENLHVLVAGNVPPNPSELLVSTRMRKLLQELKEMCDLIIIDGTPCDLVTDSIIISRFVDSTIIVTAQKETKKDALERIVKNIQNVGGRIAGVVVNKVDISTRKYNQSYYYGSKSTTNISNASKHSKKSDDMLGNLFRFMQKSEEDEKKSEKKDFMEDDNLEVQSNSIEDEEKSNEVEQQEKITKLEEQNETIKVNKSKETEMTETNGQSNNEYQKNSLEENFGFEVANAPEEFIQKIKDIEQQTEETPELKEKNNNGIIENIEVAENITQNELVQDQIPKQVEPEEIDIPKDFTRYNNDNHYNQHNKKNRDKRNRNKNKRNRKDNYNKEYNNNYDNSYNREYNNNYDNSYNKEYYNNNNVRPEEFKQNNVEKTENKEQNNMINSVEMADSAKDMPQDKANEIMNLVNSYIESEKQKQERKY